MQLHDVSVAPSIKGLGATIRAASLRHLPAGVAPPNKAMKLTSALAERADLLGVASWRSPMGRQEAPRRPALVASVRRTGVEQ